VLLGTSLSGKTTIHRQLSALCGYRFTKHEREDIRVRILDNLVSASLLVSFKIDDSGIQLSTEARKVRIAWRSPHPLTILTRDLSVWIFSIHIMGHGAHSRMMLLSVMYEHSASFYATQTFVV